MSILRLVSDQKYIKAVLISENPEHSQNFLCTILVIEHFF